MSDFNLDDEHPLSLELASLRAAVLRYQHEAHSESVKLQRHSLETSLAVEHTHVLEQENARLREEVEVLRTNPQAPSQTADLQVSELTLGLRKLSDRLNFTDQTLLTRSTELAHCRSELGKAKYDVDATMILAKRINARKEELEQRERELKRRALAAEEERKLADLVVEEYAALVRKLEGRPSRTSIAVSQGEGATPSPATLTACLADGRAGLQRLLGEFNSEVDSLASELSGLRLENENLHATLQAERQRSEADRESLAQVLVELDKYKADDNTATKMVARYMKFSQSATNALQKSMDNLRARHEATRATLNTQIEHLHKALLSERRQTEKLREALDQLSEDISREAYGRRREISLRLSFLGREEALAESLRRWLRKSKESAARALSQPTETESTASALQNVLDKALHDAEGLLETLNGQPTAEGHPAHGTIARILAAQTAVSALTRELQDETHRRLEAQKMLACVELAVDGATAEAYESEAPPTPPQSTTSLGLPAEHTEAEHVGHQQASTLSLGAHVHNSSNGHDEQPSKISDVVEPEPKAAVHYITPSSSVEPQPPASDVPSPIPKSSDIIDQVHSEPDSHPVGRAEETTIVVADVMLHASAFAIPQPRDNPTPVSPSSTDFHKDGATSILNDVSPHPTDAMIHIVDVQVRDQMIESIESNVPQVDATPCSVSIKGLHHPLPRASVATPIVQHLSDLIIDDLPSVTVEFVEPEESTEDVSGSLSAPLAPSAVVRTSPTGILLDTLSPVDSTPLHPLLAELDLAKHRYDDFQKAYRDCGLALKDLKKDVGDLSPASDMSAVIWTAVERLNDFSEDTRVELEIRVADEERMISGYATLLSVPGALMSDELDGQDLVQEIELFVSGESPAVSRALQQFSRKLDDLEHDIACLKRSLHELASGETSPPPTATSAKGTQGWSSWTGGILGGGSSRPVSPAPTFGSVMTTPRLRQPSFGSFMHRPSLPNLHSTSNTTGGTDERENPFASLGLKIPMPAHALPQTSPTQGLFLSPGLSSGPARPQKPRTASASMYLLGLGARSTGYGLQTQSVKPSPSKLATNADNSDGGSRHNEADSDVE